VNRIDLQQLAEARLREAAALLNAGEWSGTYYLAGYAVECGLKACIAKLTGLHDFPDKSRVLKSYSHKLVELVDVADLEPRLDAEILKNPVFRTNWTIVRRWNETARYAQWTEPEARQLFDAINHPTDGVLSWVKSHW